MDASLLLAAFWLIVGLFSLWHHTPGELGPGGKPDDALLMAGCVFIGLALGTLVGRRWVLPDSVETRLEAHRSTAIFGFYAIFAGLGLWMIAGSSVMAPLGFGAWFGYSVGAGSDAAERIRAKRTQSDSPAMGFRRSHVKSHDGTDDAGEAELGRENANSGTWSQTEDDYPSINEQPLYGIELRAKQHWERFQPTLVRELNSQGPDALEEAIRKAYWAMDFQISLTLARNPDMVREIAEELFREDLFLPPESPGDYPAARQANNRRQSARLTARAEELSSDDDRP